MRRDATRGCCARYGSAMATRLGAPEGYARPLIQRPSSPRPVSPRTPRSRSAAPARSRDPALRGRCRPVTCTGYGVARRRGNGGQWRWCGTATNPSPRQWSTRRYRRSPPRLSRHPPRSAGSARRWTGPNYSAWCVLADPTYPRRPGAGMDAPTIVLSRMEAATGSGQRGSKCIFWHQPVPPYPGRGGAYPQRVGTRRRRPAPRQRRRGRSTPERGWLTR